MITMQACMYIHDVSTINFTHHLYIFRISLYVYFPCEKVDRTLHVKVSRDQIIHEWVATHSHTLIYKPVSTPSLTFVIIQNASSFSCLASLPITSESLRSKEIENFLRVHTYIHWEREGQLNEWMRLKPFYMQILPKTFINFLNDNPAGIYIDFFTEYVHSYLSYSAYLFIRDKISKWELINKANNFQKMKNTSKKPFELNF